MKPLIIEIEQGIICIDDRLIYGVSETADPKSKIAYLECKGRKLLDKKDCWAKKAKYYQFSKYSVIVGGVLPPPT